MDTSFIKALRSKLVKGSPVSLKTSVTSVLSRPGITVGNAAIKIIISQSDKVAQWVKHLIHCFDSGHDLSVGRLSTTLGFMLNKEFA